MYAYVHVCMHNMTHPDAGRKALHVWLTLLLKAFQFVR